SGASAGIGFAIPVNTVRDVVPQLISYGRVLRPMIGVELASDRWVQRYRIEGLPVVQAYPGLPAAEAGITGAFRNARGEVVLGDIITHINDKPIRSQDDYFSALEVHDPGDTVKITSRVGDRTRSYEVELIESQ
ncbi:MAG: PDZ domain-containing protein, partial [Halioglobus sp.]|nr:PDZ domain-containing protein [Halioglobus sp.]